MAKIFIIVLLCFKTLNVYRWCIIDDGSIVPNWVKLREDFERKRTQLDQIGRVNKQIADMIGMKAAHENQDSRA